MGASIYSEITLTNLLNIAIKSRTSACQFVKVINFYNNLEHDIVLCYTNNVRDKKK